MKNKQIKKLCSECSGYGGGSSCCEEDIINNRCGACGKYAKELPCETCQGSGYEIFEIGVDVSLWQSPYVLMPKKLMKQLTKKPPSNSFLYGKVTKILKNNNVEVKFKGTREPVNINVKLLNIS